MNCAAWGSGAWNFGSAIIFNAPLEIPQNSQQVYKKFFDDGFKTILPCKYCRESYIQYLQDLPIEAFYDTRAGLAVFWYKMHSKVNKKLDKADISFFEYVKNIESMRAKCSKTGAKGCTEPHIEKNNQMCLDWAKEAWSKYGEMDIEAWRKKQFFIKILWWVSIFAVSGLICKFILSQFVKFIIRNRNSGLVKNLA